LAAGGSGGRLVETNLPRNIRLELVDAEESRERDGCPFPAFHFAIGPIDFPMPCAVKGADPQRGTDPPGNWFAPPGNNRSVGGGNEAGGAFDEEGRLSDLVSVQAVT